MAKVTDPMSLFEYKLGVALAGEKAVERMLRTLAKEANDAQLRSGFERHADETREHIRNVEQVFERVGRSASAGKAPAAEGLELQHKAFAAEADETVLPEVLDLVAVGSAIATEHHEIATYETLIALAESLGASDAVPLLRENLAQEQNMLEQAKTVGQRLGSMASADMEATLQPGRL